MPGADTVVTRVDIDPHWLGVGAIFGGHVVYLLVHAARVLDGFSPLSASLHFLGSVRSGPAELSARVVHAGASTATVAVALEQGHTRATALVKLARGASSPRRSDRIDVSRLADPATVQPAQLRYGHLPFERYVDLRMLPSTTPFESQAWIRLREPLDEAGIDEICELLDALPPGAFEFEPAPSFVPTIDFTVHFVLGEVLEAGWHLATQRLVWSSEELCVEESEVRTARGELIALARQSRRIVA